MDTGTNRKDDCLTLERLTEVKRRLDELPAPPHPLIDVPGGPLATHFGGVKIVESIHCTEAGEPYEVKRTWKERLFSRPWRPFKASYTVIPQVPMKGGYSTRFGLVMHPETVKQAVAGIETVDR